ncbi:GyrI-like domain-containing protein, partial [Mycobacterium tuberculosis]|nr:GyrI-like domain-containing protein [Mycobacterium tuberculosis]
RHDFCIPVTSGTDYGGAFCIATLAAATYASAMIEGPLTQTALVRAYDDCARQVAAAGRTFTGESREIYHRWGGMDAADNRVEIAVVCR